MLLFFLLVFHDCVLLQITFHPMCIFQYTTAVMFVFIVHFLIVMILPSHHYDVTWLYSQWTQVQHSLHVFCLYVRFLFGLSVTEVRQRKLSKTILSKIFDKKK